MQIRERMMERQNGYFLDDFESSVLSSLLKRLQRAGYGNEGEIIDEIESNLLLSCGRVVNAVGLLSHAFAVYDFKDEKSLHDFTQKKDMFCRGAHIALYALTASMEKPYLSYFPRLTQSVVRASSSQASLYAPPLQKIISRYGLPGYKYAQPETKRVLDDLFPRVVPMYLQEKAPLDVLRESYETGAGFMLASRNLYDDEQDRLFLRAEKDEELFRKLLAKLESEIEQIYNENA